MENEIRYSVRIPSCTVLGPYNRAVLWVHGCCFQCEGCLAEVFKTGEAIISDAKECAEWFLQVADNASNIEGITISGGEPMLQAAALADMISYIRREKNIGVIVYSGFTYEELQTKAETDDGILRFLQEIDLLIDGRYEQELDYGQPYRGSENQQFRFQTDRYREVFHEYYEQKQGRDIQLMIASKQVVMAGVPTAEQLQMLKRIGMRDRGNEG